MTLAAVCAVSLMAGCSNQAEEPVVPTYKTGLKASERNSSEFGKVFPQQYNSYLKNSEDGLDTETRFKASFHFRKNDDKNKPPTGKPNAAQPYLKNLWEGYPFMYEYNEARGHTYAVEDILRIDRINNYSEKAGLPATCWNCKVPTIPDWVAQYGDDKFWSMNFHDFRSTDKIDMKNNSIGCANCHNPEDMTLAVTSIPLNDSLKRKGVDWKTMSRNDKRALVCGQCHVEYYFSEPDHGPNKKPVFPWDVDTDPMPNGTTFQKIWGNGMDPEQIYAYYADKGPKKEDGSGYASFADWVHPVSKARMLKAQHPEFETWYNGTHGAAGVTCADCHMPYQRLDGKKKVSQHQWTSPLRTDERIDTACRQCHTDKTVEYLRTRVQATQKKTYDQLIIAQDISVKAHEAVRRASEWTGERSPQYDALMAEAREYTRKGQFFWDYVSAENSVGFHNPVKALETLALSQQYSQKAVEAAYRASNYGFAAEMDSKPIRELVPPILEWSREMQMNPANLETHVWLKYLKPLPESKRVWDVQTKVQ